jgi:hypothetical protein
METRKSIHRPEDEALSSPAQNHECKYTHKEAHKDSVVTNMHIAEKVRTLG